MGVIGSPLAHDGSSSPDPAFAGSPANGDTPLANMPSRGSRVGPGVLTSAAAINAAGWNRDPGSDDGAVEMTEKPRWADESTGRSGKRRTWLWVLVGVIVAAIIALAVGLGVHFGTKKSGSNDNDNTATAPNAGETSSSGHSSSTATSSSSAARPSNTPVPINGFSGSKVLLTNGTEVTYNNPHGGMWAYDASDPFVLNAQPNSWTRPLNQSWDYTEKIYGVALGGWFVTEPFICPYLYEKYATGPGGTAIDEYTLSLNMGNDLQSAMEAHYDTFITEQDFIDIVAAGLTWIRLPIPHWAIETYPGEPFLEGVSWKYIVRALGWARKYGLRVNLDLHTVPGSQNGWNHSGKLAQTPSWMYGAMGLANMQRTLDYIRTILEFILQPEWEPVVQMFGIVNEPLAGSISQEALGAFYLHAHDMIRNITGTGTGKGPYISIHEGFIGVGQWYGFATDGTNGMDRVQMDVHNYLVFQDQNLDAPAVVANQPCQAWAAQTNATLNQFGTYNTGEWSNAINDCGHWVNGVGQGTRYEGTFSGYGGANAGANACDYWNDPTGWTPATITAIGNRFRASSDALGSNFFWTWKISESTIYNHPVSPMWSYKLGLDMGFIPNDPRTVLGYCEANAGIVPTATFTGYKSYMTGGAGAGNIPASASSAHPWPLTSMAPSFNAADLARLPQYTQTATPVTLANPTYKLASSVTQSILSGWAVPTDTQAVYTPVSGCSYPGIYDGATMGVPSNACGAGAQAVGLKRDAVPEPVITPALRR